MRDQGKTTTIPTLINNNASTGQELLSPEDADQTNSLNPAQKKFYSSKTSRDSAIKFAAWAIPIIITIALVIGGFYLTGLREPIIRLEEKFNFLKEAVDKNSQDIETLKKTSFPTQSLQPTKNSQ